MRSAGLAGLLSAMNTEWTIAESAFRVEHNRAYEGLFAQGSGYLQVRGSLEEHFSEAPQNVAWDRRPANVTSEAFPESKAKWGTYVPGVFGPHPQLNNEMINLPWFLGLTPEVNGQRLDLQGCRIESHRRELDLHRALLSRELTWIAEGGARVDIHFERFINAARPHLCVQRMRVSADREVDLRVMAGLDADVRTNGYDHLRECTPVGTGDGRMRCTVTTDASDEVRMACRLAGLEGWEVRIEPRRVELHANARTTAATIEKRTAVATSRDLESTGEEEVLEAAAGMSWDELLAEHAAVWEQRWQTCDIEIEGEGRAQLAVRVALYHLLRAHVPDSRVAVDAKGYSGEAYWGRFFWDTEMFLLPFHLYTDPARARTLVDFRVQSLPGARRNAARYGYPGARYAWESDAAGDECCPNWQYADHEVHITADVVHGLAHYAAATGDTSYLAGPAGDVVLETARYWLARVDHMPEDDHPSLLGVMGPDEYTPISSNNAYTNALVAFALMTAADVARARGLTQEAEGFEAGAGLPILNNGELVLQCAEFDSLAEPRFEERWPDRSRPFASVVHQERLYRSKALKQADVLMLMALFPAEFTKEEVQAAWDYYLPYTTHDSSLSAGVHAVVACRLGLMDKAREFWERGCGLDLDLEHGGAAEGVHIANAGAVWQMLVYGFAGLQTALEVEDLTLEPRLPANWRRLAMNLCWKGTPVRVSVTAGEVAITNQGERPVLANVFGQMLTVEPGTTATTPTRQES